MAFEQKEWLDRVSEFPMRRQLTDEDGNVELVTLERADGEVSTEGDAFSASNMNDLEQRVADAFDSIDLSASKITFLDSVGIGSDNVQGALEALKKSVSDGKSKVASAITGQGVSTSADATFETMASNITTAGNNRYNAGYSKGGSDAKYTQAVQIYSGTATSVSVSGYKNYIVRANAAAYKGESAVVNVSGCGFIQINQDNFEDSANSWVRKWGVLTSSGTLTFSYSRWYHGCIVWGLK